LLPQLVPAGWFPLATHWGDPVEQEVAPFWQGLLGWQDVPAVQVLQVPAPLQTMFVPQLVPADLLVLATHWDDPVEQDVVPFWQGLLGWQDVPAVQAVQFPLPSQTWLVPQLAPAGWFPLATQT
jgi:hypothetical protein